MTEPTVPVRTSDPSFAYLIIAAGDQAGAIFQLSDTPATLGRAPGSSIRLEDPAVSAEHFRVRREGGVYLLSDLGSENGVQVNGERVQRRDLQHDDAIVVGRTSLVFKQIGLGA